MSWEIRQGDVLERLRELPAASVHCCVTSPPYWGLRDYGVAGQIGLEATPEAFTAVMVAVFGEVRRVLRADGTLWLNLGDSYAAQQGAGFNTNAVTGGTNRVTKMQEQCGDIRVKTGLPPKNLVGIPWRVAFALQADGWYLRSDIIWAKPNPMPESVTDRPTKAHEYLFLLAKSERYHYDADAIKEPALVAGKERVFGKQNHDSSAAMRVTAHTGNMVPGSRAVVGDNRNRRTVWTVATQPFSEAHFATFPPELVKPCILAGCPEGGTVLDPFSGAGTTGLVAVRHGRNYIGIELNPAYAEMSERRIAEDAPLFNVNVTTCTTFSEA